MHKAGFSVGHRWRIEHFTYSRIHWRNPKIRELVSWWTRIAVQQLRRHLPKLEFLGGCVVKRKYFRELKNNQRLQAGCAVDLTKAVLNSKDPTANGFAAIRPPGHHASSDKACGFCLFNNVAICAKKVWFISQILNSEKFQAIEFGRKRVLIVDFDVHAGQGTQYSINDDPNIRLVSIHRFEEGKFWLVLISISYKNTYFRPQLPESSVVHECNPCFLD